MITFSLQFLRWCRYTQVVGSLHLELVHGLAGAGNHRLVAVVGTRHTVCISLLFVLDARSEHSFAPAAVSMRSVRCQSMVVSFRSRSFFPQILLARKNAAAVCAAKSRTTRVAWDALFSDSGSAPAFLRPADIPHLLSHSTWESPPSVTQYAVSDHRRGDFS